MTKIQKSVRFSTRARLMVGAGTVLPLLAFAVARRPRRSAPDRRAVRQRHAAITADTATGYAPSRSRSPLEHRRSRSTPSVTDVTGTHGPGRPAITSSASSDWSDSHGAINGTSARTPRQGGGERLGLGATTHRRGDHARRRNRRVDGASSAGIAAISTNGDIGIAADGAAHLPQRRGLRRGNTDDILIAGPRAATRHQPRV